MSIGAILGALWSIISWIYTTEEEDKKIEISCQEWKDNNSIPYPVQDKDLYIIDKCKEKE